MTSDNGDDDDDVVVSCGRAMQDKPNICSPREILHTPSEDRDGRVHKPTPNTPRCKYTLYSACLHDLTDSSVSVSSEH